MKSAPPAGAVAAEFEIERSGRTYKIEIVDDTERKQRYNIIVTNCDDPTDRDYLSIA